MEDGSTFGESRDLDDIRCMSATGAFGMESMNSATLEGCDGVLDEAGFVERVGVDHHLHVEVVGDGETAVDCRRGRSPILVQLERAGARPDHLFQRGRARRIAFAGKAEVHGQAVRRLDHAADVPRPRRAGGGEGAVCRPGAAAQHGSDAGHECLLHLLRADEVDMRVETARGDNLALAGNHLCAWPDHDVDAGLDVGVARLSDRGDAVALKPDVGFYDAPVIENERIGDDGIHRPLSVADLALAHAVADHLAAAELDLLAISAEITLHLDDEVGIGKPYPVPGGWTKHVRIDRA